MIVAIKTGEYSGWISGEDKLILNELYTKLWQIYIDQFQKKNVK